MKGHNNEKRKNRIQQQTRSLKEGTEAIQSNSKSRHGPAASGNTLWWTSRHHAEAEAGTTLSDLRNCIKTKNRMSWTGNITTRVENDCSSAKNIYIDRVWPFSDGTCSRVEAGGTKTWNQGRWNATWKATGKEC